MTYSRSRIDAHQNGDCDAATCPLCEAEDAADLAAGLVPCDECDVRTDEPADCDHGNTLCADCHNEGACHLCDQERADDIADDIATELALDQWRGVA